MNKLDTLGDRVTGKVSFGNASGISNRKTVSSGLNLMSIVVYLIKESREKES